jgi:exopolyphosphatase/guanosine-5'-triphosphate,3'-diphosphate pyrophosphatase
MTAPALLAALDLGSNSFRLVIGRVEPSPLGEQIRPVDELKETVRLGAGLNEDGTLAHAAQTRALAALQRFGERLRTFAPEAVRAVATNTFRVAQNIRPFMEEAQAALGFPIEIIAGREEARLIYLGAAHALPADGTRRLVIDIGGGSTECIIGTDYQDELLESVPLGCVSVSQKHFPQGILERNAFHEARLSCRAALSPLSQRYRHTGWDQAVGTSGTAKALSALMQAQTGSGRITSAGLNTLETALTKAGQIDRLRLEGLKPDRRGVLAGGLAMMTALFAELELESLIYCDSALREGVLYDLLGRSAGADMREITVARMIQHYTLDPRDGQAVADLACRLHHDATAADAPATLRRMVRWAAQLREIGLSLSHSDFHRHGAYILAHADMPGFSHDEQARLATLVLGQTGGLSKLRAHISDPHDWIAVLCLRLAAIVHRRRDGQVPPWMTLRFKTPGACLELPADWMSTHPLTDHLLRNEAAEWHKAGPWPLHYALR